MPQVDIRAACANSSGAPLPSPPLPAVRRPLRPTARGGGCIGRAASVYREMQICRAFKTPTTLLHFLLRVNSQQTAADQYRCSIG